MTVKYFQIRAGSKPPEISDFSPFRAIVIIEEAVIPEWQTAISTWLVESGCLYMMAWGMNCSSWDDSVDFANLEQFDFGEIPEDKSIMTTWHENDPLDEVFLFAKGSARHPSINLHNTVLLHISENNREAELLNSYANA